MRRNPILERINKTKIAESSIVLREKVVPKRMKTKLPIISERAMVLDLFQYNFTTFSHPVQLF